jgi:AP endonuclease-2
VYAVIQPEVTINGEKICAKDIMNPPGVFLNGQRVREIIAKDLLPTSGKLLPEFDKRRTIKDMFQKKVPALPTILGAQATSMEDNSKTLGISEDGKMNHVSLEVSTSPTWTLSASQSINPSPVKVDIGKRTPITSKVETPPPKRQRSSTIKEQRSKTSGQQTLQNFFQPKQAKKNSSAAAIHTTPEKDEYISRVNGADPNGSQLSPPNSPASGAIKNGGSTKFEENAMEEKFIDPFTTRTEWTKLFSRQAPPRCEGHQEPCTSLQTKVKGPNCGRWFWICPR